MSEEVPPTDLLPLVFTTALVVYVLVMGSGDLARTVIRLCALASLAFCLAVWGAAALSYAGWGGPVIDEFYATAILARQLGAPAAGWLLLALAAVPVVVLLREMRRLATVR
ncbi:MAG: hypothetical protein Kow00114_09710 [Kiloniellaceae bacterium]